MHNFMRMRNTFTIVMSWCWRQRRRWWRMRMRMRTRLMIMMMTMIDNGWLITDRWWLMTGAAAAAAAAAADDIDIDNDDDDGWWMMGDRWWMMDDGWMVEGGWLMMTMMTMMMMMMMVIPSILGCNPPKFITIFLLIWRWTNIEQLTSIRSRPCSDLRHVALAGASCLGGRRAKLERGFVDHQPETWLLFDEPLHLHSRQYPLKQDLTLGMDFHQDRTLNLNPFGWFCAFHVRLQRKFTVAGSNIIQYHQLHVTVAQQIVGSVHWLVKNTKSLDVPNVTT